ncbi:hypothetical protein AAHE18_20G143200 [Arachis hypogaea]
MVAARLHNHTKAQGGAEIRDFMHRGGRSRGFTHYGGEAKGRRRREEDGWAAVVHGGAATSGFDALPSEFVGFCGCGDILGYKIKYRLPAVLNAVAANQSDAAAHGCQLVLSLISSAVGLTIGNFWPVSSVSLVVCEQTHVERGLYFLQLLPLFAPFVRGKTHVLRESVIVQQVGLASSTYFVTLS